jgi:hypothetical protein
VSATNWYSGLREELNNFLGTHPDAFELEYAQVLSAWLDWRDWQLERARSSLEAAVKRLPEGNVARSTARFLLVEMAAGKKPPDELLLVARP